ncbi:alpha/beta hydrolase fold domain-containing protein [Luteolibacter sp. Populi]|uniref:alpha/beta hydrolase fold domain-containing protein n=1 Tax=Luteolibacter sp. Populi TaxID=3230487 RepID=UPI0034678BED
MRWPLFLLLLAPSAFAQADPFASLDTDKNGKLSLTEVPENLRPHFPLVDTNGDKSVDRAEFQAALIAANSLPKAPAGGAAFSHFKNIDYVGGKNPRQALDLIVPKDAATKKRPLVVFIHGGGWLAGRKEDGLPVARLLASSGDYVAATINYRLTQEAQWPAQIHDCKAAIRFLRANAAEYGIDPDHIGIMGMSAGGQLVSVLGTGNDEPLLEGTLGKFAKISSRVQCVVNFFGPTDFLSFFGPDTTFEKLMKGEMIPKLLGTKKEEVMENARQASAVTWISKDDAPFLTAHGTEDTLVPLAQAEEIHAKLKKAAVESHLIVMQGAGHGFANDDLNRRIKTFLDKELRGIPGEISDAPIKVN